MSASSIMKWMVAYQVVFTRLSCTITMVAGRLSIRPFVRLAGWLAGPPPLTILYTLLIQVWLLRLLARVTGTKWKTFSFAAIA